MHDFFCPRHGGLRGLLMPFKGIRLAGRLCTPKQISQSSKTQGVHFIKGRLSLIYLCKTRPQSPVANATRRNCLISWCIPLLENKISVRSLNPLSCCCSPSLDIPDLKQRLQALNLLILILPEPNRNTLKVTYLLRIKLGKHDLVPGFYSRKLYQFL